MRRTFYKASCQIGRSMQPISCTSSQLTSSGRRGPNSVANSDWRDPDLRRKGTDRHAATGCPAFYGMTSRDRTASGGSHPLPQGEFVPLAADQSMNVWSFSFLNRTGFLAKVCEPFHKHGAYVF